MYDITDGLARRWTRFKAAYAICKRACHTGVTVLGLQGIWHTGIVVCWPSNFPSAGSSPGNRGFQALSADCLALLPRHPVLAGRQNPRVLGGAQGSVRRHCTGMSAPSLLIQEWPLCVPRTLLIGIVARMTAYQKPVEKRPNSWHRGFSGTVRHQRFLGHTSRSCAATRDFVRRCALCQ